MYTPWDLMAHKIVTIDRSNNIEQMNESHTFNSVIIIKIFNVKIVFAINFRVNTSKRNSTK